MNCSEHVIFLLGRNKLQTDLMSRFLAQPPSLSCIAASTLAQVPCTPDARRVLLYDCSLWEETVKGGVSEELRDHLRDNFLVLFNVPQGSEIENDALRHGVRGFLYTDDGCESLQKMVQTVANGELWVTRNVMTEYIQWSSRKSHQPYCTTLGLTSRELDVLASISQGSSNDMIAESLCISPHTVKTHVYRIFKKINVSSRLQAAKWSSQHLYL